MELQKLVAGSADKEEEILRFVHGTNVRAWELLGCHYLGDGIYRFRVWAPQARAVALVGDFNDWDPAQCHGGCRRRDLGMSERPNGGIRAL